uniref:Ig-like domain-containing protein n=1 Tax=Maylandia zebra TaxID=106582 RepID=A0A3P9BNI8_9CICH
CHFCSFWDVNSWISGKGNCVTLSERELTAEAGLCVVIPCSFTTAANFTPKHTVWYKCEASKKCSDADITFHSNKNNEKVQSGFKGRVSRLEPDVSQKNCSIIINDLKESDSGFYQLRVTVKLQTVYKPTVMIPTLTEGQQATLTCTAPGLCSGSVPQITWTWRGEGGTESYITGNSTVFKTEGLTPFTQRHVSTLTFNPSAEHHNTNVTCKIRFTGDATAQKTSGLNDHLFTCKNFGALNLTCNVHSFPPSLIIWSKLGYNETLHIDTGSANLVIINVTAGYAGQYVCTAKYMNNTLKDKVNVTVICEYTALCFWTEYISSRNTSLHLVFVSIQKYIHYKKVNIHSGTYSELHSDTGSATLVVYNSVYNMFITFWTVYLYSRIFIHDSYILSQCHCVL